jgi:glycosyltransferase involved in cell wall biosynthesis
LQIAIYGPGARLQDICVQLTGTHLPQNRIDAYESLEAALKVLHQSAMPVLLLDARIAPDERITRFARANAPAIGTATTFEGLQGNEACAFLAANGAALKRLVTEQAAPRMPVGSWMTPTPAGPVQARNVRVNVRSSGLAFTGYATAARHLMIGMRAAGVDVTWSRDWVEQESADVPKSDRELLEQIARSDDPGADFTLLYNTPTYSDGRAFLARYRETIVPRSPLICATMFETDAIPARWAAALNTCEAVWVPSTYNKHSFAAGGVDPQLLHVVPIGLDVENYALDGDAMELPERRAFNFLSVFEWNRRKGYDVLLRAYSQAFRAGDDVALFIRSTAEGMTIDEALAQALRELGLKRKQMAPIVLLRDKIPQTLLPALYRAIDAFVLPSRGEAFGIPYAEAMALGVPVIGTAFGGPLDFLRLETGYPVPCTLGPVDAAFAEKMPVYRGQRWAEPSVEATAAAMRAVRDDAHDAKARAARAAELIRTQFNRDTTGRTAAGVLQSLPKKQRARPAPDHGKLQYVGIPASLAGYGSETRAFLSALDRQSIGVELAMYNYENLDGTMLRGEEARLINRSIFLKSAPGSPVLYHLLPTQVGEHPDGRAAIVRTMEETDGLGEGWVEALERFDQIWLPSIFNADTFERAGVDPKRIRIVPGCIDTDFWSPSTGGMTIPGAANFRFLAVFDWMARKGWDTLVTAFMRAFSMNDDVSLTLKVTDLVARAEGEDLDVGAAVQRVAMQAAPQKVAKGTAPRVLVLSQRLSEDDLARLYASHHAFVGPSHSEGWGRAHFEAMACGLPTIGTRWGGNLAFMNDANSYLVDIEGLIEAHGTGRYVGRRWAQPSVEHLEKLLRRVYERPYEARARARQARDDLVHNFSLDVVGATLRERLEEVTQLDFPAAWSPGIEAKPELAIIVDARNPTACTPESLRRILVHTRSTRTITVLCQPDRKEEIELLARSLGADEQVVTDFDTAVQNARRCPFVAIVRADVYVSIAWDRDLIEVLSTQFSAGCAVPHFYGIGLQPENDATPNYNLTTLEHFDQYAIRCMTDTAGKGAYALAFPPLCLVMKSAMYQPAEPNLFPATLPAGYQCWTAFDCIAHLAKQNAS